MLNRTDTTLCVLEMANNHQGDVDHGLRIINEFADVAEAFPYRFALKFQYRNLPEFIHSSFRDRTDLKFVKRFSDTMLSRDQFNTLKDAAQQKDFVTVCTPFDEVSVDRIEEDGFDILKIASCSFTDWPLLERIAQTDLPIIASTGGATVEEMDRVVSFFTHRNKQFALMHCVAKYPTPPEEQRLNRMMFMQNRYPDVSVGFSTHEPPSDTNVVRSAVAMGANIFEKHVAVATDDYGVNAYSATPDQYRAWLEALTEAKAACGEDEGTAWPEDALATLDTLKRAIYATRDIPAGTRLTADDYEVSFPWSEGQIHASDLSKYNVLQTTQAITKGAAINHSEVATEARQDRVMDIMKRVKTLVDKSGQPVPKRIDIEISHHYGLERFEEVGCAILNYVNREYCKKLIVCLPKQRHPEQYHNKKEETFHVVWGSLKLTLDGEMREHGPGEMVVVERGTKHAFSTDTGVVIEEISSTHYKDDSYYTDPAIAENPSRKTSITYWLD